jgi:hypothetical protein
MVGYLDKKSSHWTEYLKVLWSGKVTWKRKFYVLTNVGLLVYKENEFDKPKKLIHTVDMYLRETPYKDYRRNFVF